MSASDTATRTKLRVAVFGVGAVGGVFGARLAQAGHDVWFIARGATRDALRANGLRLDSVDGDLHLEQVQVTDDPSQVGPVDVVLVGVKATQVTGVAPSMRALLGPNTVVIPLQNGVEASVRLADALGAEHVLEGLCRVIAAQAGPGHIRHPAVTPVLEFGARQGSTLPEATAAMIPVVADAMRGAGINTLVPADMTTALWEKFLFIEPIGVVGAASHQPYGTVRSVPETRALTDQAIEEVIAVGRAVGVQWPADAKEQIWKRYDSLPPNEFTSMARDLIAERPSEFDAQTSAVVRLARQRGVSTPVHDVLHALLLPNVVATN
ncbi:MAG TPA: 2-dehydropantoate 2-reductase [Gemmatimonas aurantiaca]|uniref:2-dehydropantoate 2-reductase n=1 Tax=Gemmatimonas aurantiaca TaxID=173480 RepID=A0A3D4V473_9BACT|nr:2-dehydropantoate 2-reductase [Gemmatimonas aurantiaca]HCT55574.1 2-dehydropantoate 2-reductase [Gemmatimonas aurantiaca]